MRRPAEQLLSISQEDLPMSDKTVVLNAKKMNFDGNLDFSVLSSDVTVYDDTTPEQLLERIEGADIIVTKEMPVNGDLIRIQQSGSWCCEGERDHRLQYPGIQLRARSPHSGHDDLKFKLHHAGPDEDAGKRKPW